MNYFDDAGNQISKAQYRELQRKWNKTLAKKGLPEKLVDQEIYQASNVDESAVSFQSQQFDKSLNSKSDNDRTFHKSARSKVDGKELRTFHEVTIRTVNHDTPDWIYDESKIQRLMRDSFPRLEQSPAQRKKAARWTTIAYRYWRVGETANQIADGLGISENAVEKIIRRIRRNGSYLFQQTTVANSSIEDTTKCVDATKS